MLREVDYDMAIVAYGSGKKGYVINGNMLIPFGNCMGLLKSLRFIVDEEEDGKVQPAAQETAPAEACGDPPAAGEAPDPAGSPDKETEAAPPAAEVSATETEDPAPGIPFAGEMKQNAPEKKTRRKRVSPEKAEAEVLKAWKCGERSIKEIMEITGLSYQTVRKYIPISANG